MTARSRRPNPCENMNHRRANAPVGHCPQCGGVVNQAYHMESCAADQHAAMRRRQSVFCIHCGMQLIVVR